MLNIVKFIRLLSITCIVAAAVLFILLNFRMDILVLSVLGAFLCYCTTAKIKEEV